MSLRKFPFVFVADEGFALKPFMLRHFPRRNYLNFHKSIFDYRLSRARQVIENTFGILASRFRIFRRSIIGKTGNIKNITKAAVTLHNFLMRAKAQEICIVHRIMLTKKRYSDYLPKAGIMKPPKFRNWLTWKHKVLITLQELQKKSEMIPKITSTQSMVNLVGKGKLSRVLQVCRSSRPEVFLGSAALKVCSKFIIYRFKWLAKTQDIPPKSGIDWEWLFGSIGKCR